MDKQILPDDDLKVPNICDKAYLQQLEEELKETKSDIIGMSEVKRNDELLINLKSGHFSIQIINQSKNIFGFIAT